MNNKSLLIIFLVLSGLFYSHTTQRWVNYDKKVIIHKIPLQEDTHLAPFEHKGFTITPKSTFQIEARVLSKRRYFWGDGSALAPVDFALGWGPMSNYHVLKNLKITQFARWYSFRYKQPPIPKQEIISHSANMHLIPANKTVEKTINSVRRGEVILIKGYLVNVSKKDGWYWNTSLTRTDTGHGSCELIWVEEIKIK